MHNIQARVQCSWRLDGCSLCTLSLNSPLAIIAQEAMLYHLFSAHGALRPGSGLNINSMP